MKKKNLIVSAVMLATVMGISGCSKKTIGSSSEKSEVSATEPTTEESTESVLPDNWSDMYDYVPSENGIIGKAEAWMKNNKDYIGWVKINNTMVDYPVMLDPGEIHADNAYYGGEEYVPDSFYLDHYWDKTQYRDGIPYMDCVDIFEGNEIDQSENLVIYGHNMASGNMFGTLARYRQNPDYFYESPFVQMSSRYREYNYVIFACLVTPGSYNATDFTYWNMEELDTKEQFDNYVNNCRGHQIMDTGVDVQFGDKLLTLSTCYADYDNSRFIVVARRLRDGEVVNDLNTIQRTPAYLEAHPELKQYQPDQNGNAEKSETTTQNGVDTVNE